MTVKTSKGDVNEISFIIVIVAAIFIAITMHNYNYLRAIKKWMLRQMPEKWH